MAAFRCGGVGGDEGVSTVVTCGNTFLEGTLKGIKGVDGIVGVIVIVDVVGILN